MHWRSHFTDHHATICINLPFMVHSFAHLSAVSKVAAFFVVWVGVWLPIAGLILFKQKWKLELPLPMFQKLPLVMSLYAIAPFIFWAAIHLENQPFSAYGLNQPAAQLGWLGLGLGIALIGLAVLFGIQKMLGWIGWQPMQASELGKTMGLCLLLGLWVGVVEESIFRGFVFSQFLSAYPFWGAAIATSLLFALSHLIWEGKSGLPQLPGLWLMGMVLVFARWAMGGDLGLAIGLHAGWVWGLATIDTAQLIQYRDRAPQWLTGIAHNPITGLMGLLLLAVTGGAIGLVGYQLQFGGFSLR